MEHFEAGVQSGLHLHQFEKYAIGTHRIPQALKSLSDGRKDAKVPTFAVVNALLHAAVLRLPSLNSLEHELVKPEFQRLLGLRGKKGKPAFSADTMADVLDSLDLDGLEDIGVRLIEQAERNKCFRDDTYGTFRCAAIDGWEPMSSYRRHCDACLSREVKVKRVNEDGEEVVETVTQYYHRFVVAFLIAPTLDLTLAIEPVRSEAIRKREGEKNVEKGEGELSAALRLLDRVREKYGTFIDAFALDGLYACGPVLEKLRDCGYGGFIVAKDNNPYRFAEEIWKLKDEPGVVDCDPVTGESVRFFDLDDVDALDTFKGSVRVLKAEVTRKPRKRDDKPRMSRWVVILTGKAKKIGRKTALRIMRARWHIENTAFHQWVTQWNLDHCYRHTENAITAVMRIWTLAFNLMQLFFYRRLRKPRHGRKPTDTIRALVHGMFRDVAYITEPVPWVCLDGSG